MRLKEIKHIFYIELDNIYPKEEIDSFFYLLIEDYLGLERFILAVKPEFMVTKEEGQSLFEALTKLKLEQPIQYIIGKTDFFGLEFKVDKKVLIPRPETEELVQWIISDFRDNILDMETKSLEFCILDIGTGSGCIAISLAKNLPNAKIYALDISEEVLVVAVKNAKINGVEIKFIEADILTTDTLNCVFDIIVSNPPYVRESEKEEMDKNVLYNEPDIALFVTDDEPLIFYKNIVRFAKANLKEEGMLYLEINQYLAKDMEKLVEDAGFSEIVLKKDIFGNDRMLKGVLT